MHVFYCVTITGCVNRSCRKFLLVFSVVKRIPSFVKIDQLFQTLKEWHKYTFRVGEINVFYCLGGKKRSGLKYIAGALTVEIVCYVYVEEIVCCYTQPA
jgi:hypothetical protein